ncbi:DUF4440 domain-containing protein [Henriciella aquimarina]|uniref:DUF4440 domain-containing protein n=1 Tax=Henriciella aquimarina TaxID=545261 RepID=UPI0009FE986E|nr:DUF4440 domain-containing protein [Henriciella aquimarina]
MNILGQCRTGLAAAGLALALGACTTTPPETAPLDERTEAAAIDRLREDFMAAMAGADFAALGALSHPDFQQTVPGSPAHLQMYAAAGEAPLPPGYRLDITPKELVIVNEDWAYEYGTTVQSYRPEGASARVEIPNTYLLILKKHEGEWTPYREVASAMPPPGGWSAGE